jgi:hypothetical protein
MCIPTLSKDSHPPRNAEELLKETQLRKLKDEYETGWERPASILYDSVR